MKPDVFWIGSAFAMFGIIALSHAQPQPGAPVDTPVAKKEVRDAAAFAIDAQAKAMQGGNDGKPVRLELVKIASATEQVVAGMNYRLKLNVKVDGKERVANAEVWWQAWRKPDPYRLTEWEWVGE